MCKLWKEFPPVNLAALTCDSWSGMTGKLVPGSINVCSMGSSTARGVKITGVWRSPPLPDGVGRRRLEALSGLPDSAARRQNFFGSYCRYRVCSSPAPEAAMIRQGPCSLFLDKFLWDRKHNHINCMANMQTCVTLLKNTVLAFQLVNLIPMNLLIKFRLLCHLSMEQIPVITTVNVVIVHNHWGHQPSAAIRLRKPYRRLMAAMSQENREIYHIIPTIINLLITHLIFSMNPITHWNRKLQIWINHFLSKCPWKILPRSDHTGVRSHVIRWKMLVFIAGNMVILLMI